MELSVSGAVLAGGRSSRLGRDKALEAWNGVPLIARAAASLEPCAERFVVGGTAARYGFLGLPVYPDSTPGLGPLAGLALALRRARCDRVALVACDMPHLSPAYWRHLAGLCDDGPANLVIPEGPTGLEPLAALYGRECLGPVEAALAAGRLRLLGWHGDVRVRVVPWGGLEARFGPDLFRNVNTEADLEPGRS